MFKKLNLLTALLAFILPLYAGDLTGKSADAQFVSLNLCSDRLLIELTRPEQIAAMSPYSQKPLMMLDKINQTKPTVEPTLTDLLPYLDKTILVNTLFYPQLVSDLKKLNVNVIPLNDSPQTPEELFALILQLGKLTQNEPHSKALVAQLKSQHFPQNQPLASTLLLSDTGVAESELPQYQTLLRLLGLKPLQSALTSQNFSLEKLLLAQPNQLIQLSDKQGYNAQAEWLSHPLLQHFFKNRPLARLPMKYTYCFDHGVWQGAEILYNQLNASPK